MSYFYPFIFILCIYDQTIVDNCPSYPGVLTEMKDVSRKGDVMNGEITRTIQQLAVVDGHPRYTPDEFEVGEMIFVAEARVWVDLQREVVPVRPAHCS